MARLLSQTLIRESQSASRELSLPGIITRPPALKLIGARLRSGLPDSAHVVEVDTGAGADANAVEVEVLSIRRLKDAIHSLVVKEAAPKWLPFAPGASYWVPPVARSPGEMNLPDLLDNQLGEELHPNNMGREWPCSSYFLKGIMPEHSTKISAKDVIAAQSDDEE